MDAINPVLAVTRPCRKFAMRRDWAFGVDCWWLNHKVLRRAHIRTEWR
jgi:hypothetical protein